MSSMAFAHKHAISSIREHILNDMVPSNITASTPITLGCFTKPISRRDNSNNSDRRALCAVSPTLEI